MSSEVFSNTNGFLKGFAIGFVVPAAIYPFDKAQTLVQVRDKRQIISQLMREKPFKGLSVSTGYSMAKNGLIFGLAPIFQARLRPYIASEEVGKRVAEMGSAMLAPLVIAPFAVIRTRIQARDFATIKEVWQQIPPEKRVQQLWSGAGTSSLRYGFYYPTYFVTSDKMGDYLKESVKHILPENSEKLHNTISIISGGIGAIAATTVGYPLNLIANRQRVRTTHIPNLELVQQLWQRSGPKALWRGLLKLGIPRITLAGALTNWIRSRFD